MYIVHRRVVIYIRWSSRIKMFRIKLLIYIIYIKGDLLCICFKEMEQFLCNYKDKLRFCTVRFIIYI